MLSWITQESLEQSMNFCLGLGKAKELFHFIEKEVFRLNGKYRKVSNFFFILFLYLFSLAPNKFNDPYFQENE